MHPYVQISKRSFQKCKPFFIRASKPKYRITCCCRYHLEIKYVLKSCMEFRRKLNKNEQQGESVFVIYDSVYDICHETVCQKDQQGYYKTNCLQRNCDKCGVNRCNFSALENDMSSGAEFVHWSCFEYVDIKSKNDQKRKLMLVKKKTYNCRSRGRLYHEVIREISISQF